MLDTNVNNKFGKEGLTFDDVLLIPGESDCTPDMVDIHTHLTKDIVLNTPIMTSAMDTVTESKMAIAIAREGGIALFAVGSMVKTAEEVQKLLHEKGYKASIINARFIKPIDEEAVLSACEDHEMIVTMEENVLQGGFGLPVTAYIHEHDPKVKVLNIALPDAYVEHGNVSVLRKGLGIDRDSIIQRLKTENWLSMVKPKDRSADQTDAQKGN